MKPIYEAYGRARNAFLPFAGVVGVGYGPKVRGGEVVARDSIVVLVARKLPPAEVRSRERIPERFQGFPTDVREPWLTVETDDEYDVDRRPNGDWCLTDYQWLAWDEVRSLKRLRSRPAGSSEEGERGKIG